MRSPSTGNCEKTECTETVPLALIHFPETSRFQSGGRCKKTGYVIAVLILYHCHDKLIYSEFHLGRIRVIGLSWGCATTQPSRLPYELPTNVYAQIARTDNIQHMLGIPVMGGVITLQFHELVYTYTHVHIYVSICIYIDVHEMKNICMK